MELTCTEDSPTPQPKGLLSTPELDQTIMSSRSGGHDFDSDGDAWYNTRDGDELSVVLERECTLHAGHPIDW